MFAGCLTKDGMDRVLAACSSSSSSSSSNTTANAGSTAGSATGVRVHPFLLDVTDSSSISSALEKVTQRMATSRIRLRAIVNNAGVGSASNVEYTPLEEYVNWKPQHENLLEDTPL